MVTGLKPSEQNVKKIMAIQDKAFSLGWSHEKLWNIPENMKRYDRQGLVCLLRDNDSIGEITQDSIEIIKESGNTLHFYRSH